MNEIISLSISKNATLSLSPKRQPYIDKVAFSLSKFDFTF
jgi:hypothetical protein